MVMEIELSRCAFGNDGVSILAQTFGSRNTTLQKLALGRNSITSISVGLLLDTSYHITDLGLDVNSVGNEGASLLARALGNILRCQASHASR